MGMPNRDEIAEIFRRAIAGGYAVPHINHSDFGDLRAVVEAGREANTPIFGAATMMTVEAMGMDKICAVAKLLAQEAETPFMLHLDHCPNPKCCMEAIELGYNSVMIDGSELPLADNIRVTRRVVEYGHAHGVFVEGEVGHVGHGDEGSWDAKIDDAVTFVRETGVDSLAVAIGNDHGFYKAPPRLNFKLLSQVNAALPKVPLVLHGGTGIPADDVRRTIANGVRKVNVGTDVRCAYVAGLRDAIADMGVERHTGDIIAFARERARGKIHGVIDMCGSRGKA